jgi:amino acid adenylation domain-containing protein
VVKPIGEFVSDLRNKDIKLSLKGDRVGCNAPPGVLTDGLKAELAARKEEIKSFLSQAVEAARNQPKASTSILRIDRDGELPVSFQQQRLWFLDQFTPQSAGYNISGALKLSGPLNSDALERGLQAILSRHEVLRTNFLNIDGKPKLQVHSADGWKMHVIDLRNSPAAQRSDEVQRLAREEAERPFDLTRGLLLRATLLVFDRNEHFLLLTMHHIASDGWSLGVFVRELSQLYPVFCAGQLSPLPELPIQYVDYAAWHRKWLDGGVLAAQLPYWKTQLGGALPILELPSDRPRPSVQSFAGATSAIEISKELTDKLKELSRNVDATLFMILLAAFKTLLYRYGVGEDIIVGSAAANRNGTELDNLIGFFVNNLVLRTDFSGDPTPRTVIGRIREVSLNAFEHQDVPFHHLVEAIHPQRDLNHSPLFQIMFNMQDFITTSFQIADIRAEALEIDIGTTRYDLNVEGLEHNGGLKFHFGFSTDLFDKSTIRRMQDHFRILLEGFVAQPDVPISELPMLTAGEQHMFLKEWNQTSAPYPTDKCVHQLFEEQVVRRPEAVAVVFEGHKLTYRELNDQANSLARYLNKLGVVPDSLVGVWMERSLDIVVSLIAVLKAGAAYVPLDPSFPRDRLEFMVQDSQLGVLLTQEKLASNVPLQGNARVVRIDSDWAEIARESSDNFPSSAKPENLAYVIYTSGSTGKPKGVQIEHRSVVNFLKAIHNVPGLSESDKLLSVTTLSFDIAGLEIYGPLTIGGHVILASRAAALDGVSLASLLEESQATVMQATPATWRLLLESGWRGLPGLRIFCGGEALPRDLANKLLETGAEVWNLYGPTETTIWSTVAKVEPGDAHPNIGRPIANTFVYVLDARGNPVPISVPGEIYIGGDGLARGYLNRRELTAERFVPDPFRKQPGARMYRTGDIGRFQSDGTIQCLGRVDHQVKIRGFRIELGEIEMALAKAPGISQAVVVARPDGSGEQRLVAYVIAQPGSQADAAMLRTQLSMQLPEYMVPSVFVPLDAFPLTPNGKVDRKALPSPDGQQLAISTNYVSPASNKECVIAEVWQEVLKVEKVGLNDNFFDLGGHSLLLVQVQSRLRKRLNRDIMLIDLFQRPTVGSLAEFLENDSGNSPTFANVKERVRKQREALDEIVNV